LNRKFDTKEQSQGNVHGNIYSLVVDRKETLSILNAVFYVP